jgi:diguanylate cyclase (GGDEF)-like protein/hemerythrin-like metal-binding protein/PAS domain S-box-containing protein
MSNKFNHNDIDILRKSKSDYQALSLELESILDHIPGLIFFKDKHNRFIRVNKYVADAYHKTKQELQGMSLYDLHPREVADKYFEDDLEVMTSRSAKLNIEEPWDTAEGKRWVSTSKIPFIDHNGEIIGIIGISLDITEKKRADLLIQELVYRLEMEKNYAQKCATTDGLTGIANRRHFDETFTREYLRARRYGSLLSLILVDIDYFKKFNDGYGHLVGDECLQAIARTLQSSIGRPADFVARYGGEEFAVILPETSKNGAAIVAEKLRKAVLSLQIPHNFSEIDACVTISLGVVTVHDITTTSTERLLQEADEALYEAKASGRNCFSARCIAAQPSELDRHADFFHLVWRPSDESGNATIDEEHKALYSAANNLLSAITRGNPRTECITLLDSILEQIDSHFSNENAILQQADYPFIGNHRDIHSNLLMQAKQTIDKYRNNELKLHEVFDFIVFEIIFQHMFTEDTKFFPYL